MKLKLILSKIIKVNLCLAIFANTSAYAQLKIEKKQKLSVKEIEKIFKQNNTELLQKNYQRIQINEPLFNQQWHLGSNFFGSIRADAAWKFGLGNPRITVAVVDNGIDHNHIDLRDNIWQNKGEIGKDIEGKDKRYNGKDDDGNGYADDYNGYNFYLGQPNGTSPISHPHGTHVAGIIAAKQNNYGVLGVAPNVKLLSLTVFPNETKESLHPNFNYGGAESKRMKEYQRLLQSEGIDTSPITLNKISQLVMRDSSKFYSPDKITRRIQKGGDLYVAEAIRYAIKNKVQIINLSLSGNNFSEEEYLAILHAQKHNILVVAAAGNNSLNMNMAFNRKYPASYPLDNLITVGSIDMFGKITGFSNYGKETVDLFAPGKDILSTFPNGSFGLLNGTSQSAPIVSGILALIWSQNPKQTYAQVRDKLLQASAPNPIFKMAAYTSGTANAYLAIVPHKILKSYQVHDAKFMDDNGEIEKNVSCMLCGSRILCGDVKQKFETKIGTRSLADICYDRNQLYMAKENSGLINDEDELHYLLRTEIYGITKNRSHTLKMLVEGFKYSDLLLSIGKNRIDELSKVNLLMPVVGKKEFSARIDKFNSDIKNSQSTDKVERRIAKEVEFYNYADSVINAPVAYLEKHKGFYQYNSNISTEKLNKFKIALAGYIGVERKAVSLKLPKKLIKELRENRKLLVQAFLRLNKKSKNGKSELTEELIDEKENKIITEAVLQTLNEQKAEEASTERVEPELENPIQKEEKVAENTGSIVPESNNTQNISKGPQEVRYRDRRAEDDVHKNVGQGSASSNGPALMHLSEIGSAPMPELKSSEPVQVEEVKALDVQKILGPEKINTIEDVRVGMAPILKNPEPMPVITFEDYKKIKPDKTLKKAADPVGEKIIEQDRAIASYLEKSEKNPLAALAPQEKTKEQIVAKNAVVSAIKESIPLVNGTDVPVQNSTRAGLTDANIIDLKEEFKKMSDSSPISVIVETKEMDKIAKAEDLSSKAEEDKKENITATETIKLTDDVVLRSKDLKTAIVDNKIEENSSGIENIVSKGPIDLTKKQIPVQNPSPTVVPKDNKKVDLKVDEIKKCQFESESITKDFEGIINYKFGVDKSLNDAFRDRRCSRKSKDNTYDDPCELLNKKSKEFALDNKCEKSSFFEQKQIELDSLIGQQEKGNISKASRSKSFGNELVNGRRASLSIIKQMCDANSSAKNRAEKPSSLPFNYIDISLQYLKHRCLEIYKIQIPSRHCNSKKDTSFVLNQCLDMIGDDIAYNRTKDIKMYNVPANVIEALSKVENNDNFISKCRDIGDFIIGKNKKEINHKIKNLNLIYDFVKNNRIEKKSTASINNCKSLKEVLLNHHVSVLPIKKDVNSLRMLRDNIKKITSEKVINEKDCGTSKIENLCEEDPYRREIEENHKDSTNSKPEVST